MIISRLCRALGTVLEIMPKFHYAVRSGRKVGVYESWDDCKDQVNGFQGARYKKFKTAEEAWGFVHNQKDPNPHVTQGGKSQERLFHKSDSASSASSSSYRRGTAASMTYAPASMIYEPTQIEFYVNQSPFTSQRNHEDGYEASSCSFSSMKRHTSTGSSSSCSSSASSASSSSSSLTARPSGHGRAVVYTDGSCESNGRRGARAGVGVYWGDGNQYNTSERLHGRQTNQRAEITAAIRALETAKARGIKLLTLYTDSKYTMKSITEWMPRWKQNDWKTAKNTSVMNQEDLRVLDELCQDVDVNWKYVPGHANVKGNEKADSLAKAGARMSPPR